MDTRSAVPVWEHARLADRRRGSCKHCWDKIPAGTEIETTKEMKRKGVLVKAKALFIGNNDMKGKKGMCELIRW